MPTKRSTTSKSTQPSDAVKARMQERISNGSEPAELLRRFAKLQEIVAKIDSAASREDILNVVRLESRWLIAHDLAMVSFLNQPKTHYAIQSLSAISDVSDLNHQHFRIDEGTPGWVIKNQSFMVENIDSGPVFSPAIEGKLSDLGIRSLLTVPMHTGSEIIGALTFGTIKEQKFTDEDAAVAEFLGHCLATAIKHSGFLEDARKRISQIELINRVSSQITSTLHLDVLLNSAAEIIQKNFNYFDVTVFLVSEDKTEALLEAHAGNFVDFLPHGYRQKIDQGFIGWVVQNGKRVLCNDVSEDPRYLAYEYHNTKSELALPIKIDGQVVGVLNVEDTKLHAFDETDAVVLETLSDQLGIAIKNAKWYDEICQANMKLTELDKMKSEFLGIVSHDFRSPLSSIILAGKALLKHEQVQNVQRIKEYLQIIVEQANRLNQLAEDTLSITKIESGQLSYYFKIVNVERLVQDAISMVRFSSRHQIEHQVDPNAAFIKGDQTKLRQVVQNLVSNAVKYSPRGGKVMVVVEDSPPDKILLSVSDQGIGIPPDQVDKLFQKFSRVNHGEAKEIKGAGLGLWICREIVEAHGGRIWIESKLGVGTTVKFEVNKAQ